MEDSKLYVCTKKCYWKTVYEVGDLLSFAGDDTMLKFFKAKKANAPVEELLDDEPTTLAGIAKQNAQETIDSVSREGLGGDLSAGQAPVEGPPVISVPDEEAAAEEFLG